MPTAHEVRDVMSTEPVTVTRLTPFKDLVELFSSRRISAAPVLDSRNRVVGVVSQTDLLPKEAFRDHEPSRREQLLHLEEMLKAGGTTAGDLMTAPAVVIGPHAGLAEAARLMARHHVRRLPVIDGREQLVGVVSQSDLLTVFLVPDQQLADTVTARIAHALPDADTSSLTVSVTDGVVTLGGELTDTSRLPALVQTARRVEGVVDIEIHLDRKHHRIDPPPDFGALY
jgi:CBS domain-containing protein